MQIQELTYLLKKPESISESQTKALFLEIEKYPYFQALKALYLKGLKQKGSYKYNLALKQTAAHTADRSILFDFITAEKFNQNEISHFIKQNTSLLNTIEIQNFETVTSSGSKAIDNQLNKHIKAAEGILDSDLFLPKEQIVFDETETVVAATLDEIDTNTTSELKTKDKRSFSDWLKTSNIKAINRKVQEIEDNVIKSESNNASPIDNKLAIIDKFLSENPKIKPVNSNPFKPKLVNNDNVSDSIMTETLAGIYFEQKNYDKAIKAYRILSLKYPEKSSFFADQIKMIKSLEYKP